MIIGDEKWQLLIDIMVEKWVCYMHMCGLTLSIGQVEYGIQGQYMCCYNNSLLCMKLTLYVMYVNIWVQYCEPEVHMSILGIIDERMVLLVGMFIMWEKI